MRKVLLLALVAFTFQFAKAQIAITTQPASLNVCLQEQAVFGVQVDNPGEVVSYEWHFMFTQIDSTTNSEGVLETSRRQIDLIIPNSDTDSISIDKVAIDYWKGAKNRFDDQYKRIDTGRYYVKITGTSNSVTSEIAELDARTTALFTARRDSNLKVDFTMIDTRCMGTGATGSRRSTWQWGNGSTNSSVQTANVGYLYSTPGTYTICLLCANRCRYCRTLEIANDKVDNPSSIRKINADQFKIYPNPTNGRIVISSTLEWSNDLDVEIIDITGKTILSERAVSLSNGMEIDLIARGAKPGLYLVKFNNQTSSLTQKVLIRR